MMMRAAARAAARLLYPKSPRAGAFGQRRAAFICGGMFNRTRIALPHCSVFVLAEAMRRLDHPRLTHMALVALEEVTACCHVGPVEHSRPLALVLAYLASRKVETATHDAFDMFWRSIGKRESNARWGNVNAALNGIYLAVGEARDMAVTSAFESQARSSH